jgi:hypothetical protein
MMTKTGVTGPDRDEADRPAKQAAAAPPAGPDRCGDDPLSKMAEAVKAKAARDEKDR